METKNSQPYDEADEAVARRLSKLRTMPVETARLERTLRAHLPQRLPQPEQKLRLWSRPVRAVAASAAVLILIAAVFLSTSSGPVLASTAQMAQMHNDLVSGRTQVVQVDSIQAANKALIAQWPQSPAVPDMPKEHVMACCMKSVKDKKVACVLLKNEGVPVTMMVANATEMRLPTSPTRNHNGVIYHVQSSGKLNMVMAERDGRWVCLIGEVAAEQLMDLAATLRF